MRAVRFVLAVGLGLSLTACGSGSGSLTSANDLPCGVNPNQDACPASAAVRQAADTFAGPRGTLDERSVLVKLGNGGQMLWMPVYISRRSDGSAELIDYTGQAYPGGLADFRANNNLLTEDDQITAPGDITGTEVGDLVTVSGHTASSAWVIWLSAGIATVPAVAGFLFVRARRRRTDDV